MDGGEGGTVDLLCGDEGGGVEAEGVDGGGVAGVEPGDGGGSLCGDGHVGDAGDEAMGAPWLGAEGGVDL